MLKNIVRIVAFMALTLISAPVALAAPSTPSVECADIPVAESLQHLAEPDTSMSVLESNDLRSRTLVNLDVLVPAVQSNNARLNAKIYVTKGDLPKVQSDAYNVKSASNVWWESVQKSCPNFQHERTIVVVVSKNGSSALIAYSSDLDTYHKSFDAAARRLNNSLAKNGNLTEAIVAALNSIDLSQEDHDLRDAMWVVLAFIALFAVGSVVMFVSDAREAKKNKSIRKAPVVKTPVVNPRNYQSEWDLTVGRIGAVGEKLTAFETNPEQVYFTHPLMRDVTEPTTARFYDALYEAQAAAHRKFNSKYDNVDDLDALASSVERAWDAAWSNAARKARQGLVIGGRKLDAHEVKNLKTAERALALVLGGGTTPAEAAQAWDRVQRILKELGLALDEEATHELVKSGALAQSVRGRIEA